MKSLRNTLIPALRAEAQAVAIYQAEVFWTRHPERRAFLTHILREEEAHLGALSHWCELSKLDREVNRLAGWGLGTVLACLPWRLLCYLQSKAEGQAAMIYQRAKQESESLHLPVSIIEVLHEAQASENRHAKMFSIDAPKISP